ncbi:TPA: hypothetical protein ACX6NV_000548 [Photobacterium damselae]
MLHKTQSDSERLLASVESMLSSTFGSKDDIEKCCTCGASHQGETFSAYKGCPTCGTLFSEPNEKG